MKKKARPGAVPSVTFQKETHCGRIYVTVTMDPKGKPFEIFVRFGKAGHCGAAVFDGLTRILSYGLRSGLDPHEAVKALGGIGCNFGKDTCMNAVSEALREVLEAPAKGTGSAGACPPGTCPLKAAAVHLGLRGPGAK